MDQKRPPKLRGRTRSPTRRRQACRARPAPRARRAELVGSLVAPLDVNPTLKIPINIENPRKKPRTSTPPPQASVPKRSHLEPCSGTLPEGGIITGGHLHHPGGLHDEEGVVHPRG